MITHQDRQWLDSQFTVDWGYGKPPGLPVPALEQALASYGSPEEEPAPFESHQNAGDAWQGTGGGFPNPWLWPTDAAVAGSGMPSSLQGNQATTDSLHPCSLPMKVSIYGKDAAVGKLTQDMLASMGAGEDCYWLPEPGNAPSQASTATHSPQLQASSPFPSPQLQAHPGPQLQMPQLHSTHDPEDGTECRWHKSAETVGIISSDGHVFTKTAGPRRSRVSDRGARVELASICMVFDASLRCGGVHRYCYHIMEGELGAADGAGFVFDSKVRRNNIQRMRSVFLNQRGRICLRNNQQVTKLQAQLPPLTVGVYLTLLVDLDSLRARFNVCNSQGVLKGSADVSLEGLFDRGGSGQLRSGFFCAVVTGNITVGIS